MQVKDEKNINYQNNVQKVQISNAGSQKYLFEDEIKMIAAKESYIEYTFKERSVKSDGGNYLGELYEVDIEGTTKEGKKETNIFIKKSITDCKLTIMNIEDVFAKEIYFYTDLFKIYEQLQDNANVPLGERFEIVKCYHTIAGKCVFMENMAKKGFIIPNRMEPISLNYARSCIKSLAKFHALYFVLERDNPNYVETNLKGLDYHMSAKQEWVDFVEDSLKNAASVLKTVGDQFRLTSQIQKLKLSFADYFKDKGDARVLCHADYRGNNILVIDMETDSIKTIPIDYQLCYYGNPINDLFYFIFGCTDKDFRRHHMLELKELYYDALKAFLKFFDMNLENVYPRHLFDYDYSNRLLFGLTISSVLLRFILAPEDEFPDFADTDLTNMAFIPTDQYVDRIRGIFEDYVDWELI